jgi:glycosidase
MSSRFETVRTDRVLDNGGQKLADDPGYSARVLAFVMTTNEVCRVRFATGTNVVSTFYLQPGVPCVLPYNEEGWWLFPSGGDINAEVTGTASTKVAVLAVWIREE